MTNRFEILSSAALLIELSPLFRSDTHFGAFGEFARWFFNNIKKLSSGYSSVDIICDRYFKNSLKYLTRNERGHSPKVLFHDDTLLPSKFNDSFLKNNHNKEWLNLYCADKFECYQGDTHSLNVTKGESVLSSSILDESISINTADEADQKLVHHMIQCVRSGVKQWVVRTVDTDVVISLIAYRRLAENFDCVVLACLSSAVSNRFYNINKTAEEISERKCRALPFFYVLAECDIISSFFNQGKCKFWDRWTESREEEPPTTVFMELSDKTNALTEEQISVIEKFTGFVYSWRCKFNWLREDVGFRIFIAWKSTIDTTVRIRVERAYKACCVLCRLGQFSIFPSHALLTGTGDLVMDCLHLCGIHVKLLLMQIL